LLDAAPSCLPEAPFSDFCSLEKPQDFFLQYVWFLLL